MRKRRAKQVSIQNRIAANRARKPESVFSDLERQALIERLAVLAPDRERMKQENGKR